MSREVVSSACRKPASLPVFVAGIVGALCAACSSSLSPAGTVDAPSVEYIPTDGAMVDGSSAVMCSLVEVAPTSPASCRADWSCPGLGVYSFTCGQADGGSIECYCRLNRDLQKSGLIDSCGIGRDAVVATGERFCGWGFVDQGADGGGQPSDGGSQPNDGGLQSSDGGSQTSDDGGEQ